MKQIFAHDKDLVYYLNYGKLPENNLLSLPIKKANKSKIFRNFYVKKSEFLFNFVYFLNYFQFMLKY